MSSLLLNVQNLGHFFSSKILFQDVSFHLYRGQKIALMGDNGAGKSVLLKILAGEMCAEEGSLKYASGLMKAYVPQLPSEKMGKSGAQLFHKALSAALIQDPDFLLLDEPTNHLDEKNRQSLTRMVQNFRGACVFATHDADFVREVATEIWVLERGTLTVFKGFYDACLKKCEDDKQHAFQQKDALKKDLRRQKAVFERERMRHASSNKRGVEKYDRLVGGVMKMRAQNASGNLRRKNAEKQQENLEKMDDFFTAKEITPRFDVPMGFLSQKQLIHVKGSCGYDEAMFLSIDGFSLHRGEKVVLKGDNASGKTTFLKAIMGVQNVFTQGLWHLPAADKIGYLDQHYHMLVSQKTVFEHVREISKLSDGELVVFLNDYLFWGEDLDKKAAVLSGGERARLCLALISLQMPALLVFDEITNNLDMRTKEHVLKVLKAYPGAMLIVSHDRDFIKNLGPDACYSLKNGKLIDL